MLEDSHRIVSRNVGGREGAGGGEATRRMAESCEGAWRHVELRGGAGRCSATSGLERFGCRAALRSQEARCRATARYNLTSNCFIGGELPP